MIIGHKILSMGITSGLQDIVKKWLENAGVSEGILNYAGAMIQLVIILLVAVIADFVAKKIIIRILNNLVNKTRSKWDDFFKERKLFIRVAHLFPAIVVYVLVGIMLDEYPMIENVAKILTTIYIILMVVLVIDSILGGFNDVYETFSLAKGRSIKSYIQVFKIIVYLTGFIVAFSVLFSIEVGSIFAGMGALAAVLMLVFKDSILGLVAGIQISAYDMVRIGDWIEMPSHNADGDVIDISLNTVKVQNWDKTITTIPTYALVSESFYNWRGMQEAGGRRIKRNISIDMKSVKFCTKEMLEKFKKIQYLKSYIEDKEKELLEFNKKNNVDEYILVNGRRLTNIGVFRKYLEAYLRNHPHIHKNMTFLVRHLQPTDRGIPVEIYVFANDTVWANYEGIQADIFDHVLAVIPEFGLRVFQSPSGDDFQKMMEKTGQVSSKLKSA